MDVVITFVDGNDPQWREDFRRVLDVPALEKRYRDWGLLRFLLRGIETHLPFVRKVFLVVARDSQVPAWVDRRHVNVVLHEQIIPAEYLPTFNSCTIEMFLHRIPDLEERFLYFNDDMFPMMDCTEEDFFPEGHPAIGFASCRWSRSLFKRQCLNSDRLARRAAGVEAGRDFLRPEHICSPMLKSACEAAFAAVEPEILASLSPLREKKNINQYFFLDYQLFTGMAIDRRIPKRHFSLAAAATNRICSFLELPDRQMVCINDVKMSSDRFQTVRRRLHFAFERHFPRRSRFEL